MGKAGWDLKMEVGPYRMGAQRGGDIGLEVQNGGEAVKNGRKKEW